MKMLHSIYDDWYSIKRHYKCKTETTAEIRHNHSRDSQSVYNDRFSLQQRENTVYDMQVRSTNWFTSEIRSSFDYHRVKFINNLNAVFNSSTLKKNEHRSIECLFVNTSLVRSLSEQQNWNEWQSNRDHQNTTRDHWEVYSLSKIIKLNKKLLKSKLLWSSNRNKTTANHIKNTRYIRDMKWISETQ